MVTRVKPYCTRNLIRSQGESNSETYDEAGKVVYDCLGEDGIDRTVWFNGGQEIEDDAGEMIVEATFRFVHLGPWTAPDGMKFEAFTEYRLEDARRCR